MTKWIVSTPLKGTDLMKNFVCFTEVELQKLLEQYPEAMVEMKDSHLEDHAPLPLADDQQVVLDYLKNIYSDVYEDCTPLETMYLFGGRRAWSEESNLTDKEEFQVLAAFAEWGCNQC